MSVVIEYTTDDGQFVKTEKKLETLDEKIEFLKESLLDHLEVFFELEVEDMRNHSRLMSFIVENEFDENLPWFFKDEKNIKMFLPMTCWLNSEINFINDNNSYYIDDPTLISTWTINGIDERMFFDIERSIKNTIRYEEINRMYKHVFVNVLCETLKSEGIKPAVQKIPSNTECLITYDIIENTYLQCTNPIVQHCFKSSVYAEYAWSTRSCTMCPYCKTYLMNPQQFTVT